MSEFQVVHEDEAFIGHLEEVEGKIFFHVKVKDNLTRSDIRRGRELFEEIKQEVVAKGYNRLFAATPSPHFARLLGPGFIHLETIHGLELIVWELKQ